MARKIYTYPPEKHAAYRARVKHKRLRRDEKLAELLLPGLIASAQKEPGRLLPGVLCETPVQTGDTPEGYLLRSVVRNRLAGLHQEEPEARTQAILKMAGF